MYPHIFAHVLGFILLRQLALLQLSQGFIDGTLTAITTTATSTS